MRPFISVIIIAYNRKQFIIEAIKSAQNQTLDKELYEIIVVKNFRDKRIDDYINKSGIKNVYLDPLIAKGIGYKAIVGVKKARGKVICFLEDDDLFDKDKLKIVYKVFQNDEVGLYHNTYFIIYRNKVINKQYEKTPLKFEVEHNKQLGVNAKNAFLDSDAPLGNNSSLSIRKNVIEANSLKKIKFAFDAALIVSAFGSEYNLIFDDKALTLYRVHDANFSLELIYTYDKFIKKWQMLSKKNYYDWIKLRQIYIRNKRIDGLVYQNFLLQKLNYLVYAKRARRVTHLLASIKFVYINLKYGNLNRKVMERVFIAIIFLISPAVVKRLFYFAQFKKAKS
jgi:glycosyltransferase involved in cell wall biosynthesis